MLEKVKTMFLDGCNLGESRIKIMDMDSLEICTVNNIGINRPFVGSMPHDLKSSAMFFPRSLVTLSLEDNNMSHESFPMDFSCLIMLKELYLDDNPINSMPSCVRTLPRLEILSMQYCNKLKSVEYPPRTLKQLFIDLDYGYIMLEKVVFDPEMSPLQLPIDMFNEGDPFELELIYSRGMNDQEIEGMIKMQAMMTVEEKVLRSLGWTNLDFLNKKRVGTNSSESEIQMMFYEFGIFSTRYEAEEMPSWFRHRSAGPSISFTIPSSSSPNNLLTGLNICSLHTLNLLDEELDLSYDWHPPFSPMMTISNITKNRMWIYERHPDRFIKDGKCWVVLSHWMFGMNEMEAGDHVTVTVTEVYGEVIKECGVSLVYGDGEEEEDALGYYKSWNHIIGGDLSPFQTTSGEYLLNNTRFFETGIRLWPDHRKFVQDGPDFQEQKEDCWFRALSPRKLDILGPACEGKGESSGSHP